MRDTFPNKLLSLMTIILFLIPGNFYAMNMKQDHEHELVWAHGLGLEAYTGLGFTMPVDKMVELAKKGGALKGIEIYADGPRIRMGDYAIFTHGETRNTLLGGAELVLEGVYVNTITGEVQFRSAEKFVGIGAKRLPKNYFTKIEILIPAKVPKRQ